MTATGDDVVAAVAAALEALRGPIPEGVTTILLDGARIHRDHIRADTVPAVAAHLTAMGIRGECNDPERCAIAVYLARTVTLPLGYAVVGWAGVSVPTADGRWRLVQPPAAVARFLTDFDSGEYPDLVAPPAAGDLAGMLT